MTEGQTQLSNRAGIISLALLLTTALIIGGGGVRYALANLALQLLALALLALHSQSALGFWQGAPRTFKALVILTMLVPATQLVPLPEGIWQSLPGRELVAQSFALIGRSGWAPASVDPIRTLVALTGLIVPLTVLLIGWSLRRTHLISLGWVVVGLGIVTALLGVPQVLSGEAMTGVIYSNNVGSGILYGTFANRNSTGLFLVIALAFAVALPAPRPHPLVTPARIGIAMLLIIAIVLTRSRTALVLSALPLALGAFRAIAWSRGDAQGRGSRLPVMIVATFGIGMIAMVSLAATSPGRFAGTFERFGAAGDARSYIWEDAAFSAERYWPVGAGMGTFDEVFQIDESLEHITERRAGRAHNDYLEVAIEAGLPGLALIAAWLAWTGYLAWRARVRRFRWAAWSAATILLAIALQSITDYPLRNQAMLAIGSFALLLLSRLALDHEGARE